MDVTPVLELLRQKIGLNPESIGIASVEKAVREHFEMSGATGVEDYLAKVNQSPAELKELIESVVVRETSFFRNTTPFVTLQSYLKQFVLSKNRVSPLRILCFPCSTGEEAYSIAMVLFNMKLAAKQFFIFAGDISEQVLQIAEAGRYSSYSFRGEDVAFRKKYFTKQPDDTYMLKKEVLDTVHFEMANILADDFLRGHKPYDIIFCRNLLIYFDNTAKEKAVNALLGHLSEEGVLFVGHAEGANILQFGLENLNYPMSFVLAREEYAAVINDALNINNPVKRIFSPPVLVQEKATKAWLSKDVKKIASAASAFFKKAEREETPNKTPVERDILKAKQLADAGSYGEVTVICERLISEGVESAEIYYLLGKAEGSTGDSLLAEEYLKKAIYLDADFHDALVYLSILYDRMSNPEKAASFRKRAQRVKLRKEGEAE